MNILSWTHTIAANIFALGLVIFLHEFGHFIACRRLGVRVEKFAFGFGPELIGITTSQGTRFSISAFPFGGYVRPAGEDPTADVPAKADEYFGQSWPRRLIIVYAGPAMNYVLAFCLYFGLVWAKGLPEPSKEPVIGNMVIGLPADKAGLEIGDRVTMFNGRSLAGWDDLADSIHRSPGKAITLNVEREKKILSVTVTPQMDETGSRGVIGIMPKSEYRAVGPVAALSEAGRLCWTQSKQTVTTIAGKIWHRQRPDLAGPVGIFQMISRASREGWDELLFLIGFISVAIGFFNLLPLPLLDGGHAALYFWEGIVGRRPTRESIERVNTVGLAFLLSLLVFATYNDVTRMRAERAARAGQTAPK